MKKGCNQSEPEKTSLGSETEPRKKTSKWEIWADSYINMCCIYHHDTGESMRVDAMKYKCFVCGRRGITCNLIDDLHFRLNSSPKITDEELKQVINNELHGYVRRMIRLPCLFHDDGGRWMVVCGVEWNCAVCGGVGKTKDLIKWIGVFR